MGHSIISNRYVKFFSLALAILHFSSACKKTIKSPDTRNEKAEGDNVAASSKFRVLVVDDGFDVTLPVFQGKILASYSYICDKSQDGSNEKNDPKSFDEYKRFEIKEVMKEDRTRCQFSQNVKLTKSPNFAKIRSRKAEWNSFYLEDAANNSDYSMSSIPESDFNYPPNGSNQNFPPSGEEQNPNYNLFGVSSESKPKSREFSENQIKEFYSILGGEEKYNYHGTKVASLIAYKNPNVELVLVNIKLRTGETKVDECPTQKKIDWETKLYTDKDYIEAAKSKKTGEVLRQFYRMMEKYDFDFVNISFGEDPVAIREKLFKDSGCGDIKLGENRREESRFDQLIEQHQKSQGVNNFKAITILAFGNNGVQLNSLRDGEECGVTDTITVASTDFEGRIASFSNRGRCADVFVPGSGIIVAAPENFLVDGSGTSFSAPLFIRYLILNFNKSNNYSDLFRKFRGSQSYIPRQLFPEELMFDSGKGVGSFSLLNSSKMVIKRPSSRVKTPWN